MSFDVQGKLHEIFDEQQVSDKFRKREFVLEIPDGSYTQFIKFQLTQDKCNLLDQFKVGEDVKVTFNLSGKPFTKNGTTMYFTNLSAWRLESADAGAGNNNASNAGNNRAASPQQPAMTSSFISDEADNDLPF
jgi:single-strand DNA-binding protein